MAAFASAVASCHDASCGAALGECIAKHIASVWPKAAVKGWDMRGLDPSCMVLRACMEARWNDGKPATTRISVPHV